MTARRVHIVGCPRSGTTLLMELLRACFEHDAACDHETSLFQPVPRHCRVYFSKQPTDILHMSTAFRHDTQLHVLSTSACIV